MFAGRAIAKSKAAAADVSTGWMERRVVAEVAIELRISPRFTDDGAPEGTCERPLSIHLDDEPVPGAAGDDQEEMDLSAALIRAFKD